MPLGSSVVFVQNHLKQYGTKNNMREGHMDLVGKPHVGKSANGQENLADTKGVAVNAKTIFKNRS